MSRTPPLPVGFAVEWDPATIEVEPGTWLGGQPMRVLRVTEAGGAAWEELREGPVRSVAGGILARRLTDGGLAHPVPPPMGQRPAITVVVPVHDRSASLDRCLTALGSGQRVIVVDDASTDEQAVRLVAERHGATLLRLARNVGPAGARNAGVAAAATDLIAFLDSDTVPDGDWLDALAAHLHDPLVAAVAPRIEPRTGNTWSGRYTAAHSPLDLGDRPASVRPYTAVAYVPTAALLVRRRALLDVAGPDGPFDPALRVGEDVDLVWRLLAAGWRIRYQPDVRVGHDEPTSWRALLHRRHHYGTSSAALARRHPDHVAPYLVHPWFTATVLAALAARPRLALVGAGGAFLSTRRAALRAGLPPRRLARPTLEGLRQSWLGIGRYATQFAAPALLATLAMGRPRHRVAAASLLLGPALTGWAASDRRLDPIRSVLASIADDVAYGSGVLAGCLEQRTLRPLVPLSHRRQRP